MSGLVLVAPVTSEPTLVGQAETGRGSAAGLQVSLASHHDRWQALLAYQFGVARRKTIMTSYRPGFQRSHWGLAGSSFRLSRHLALRTSVWAGSGAPSSALADGFQWESSDPILGQGDLQGILIRVPGALNSLTLPPYVRVDLGVRGGWEIKRGDRATSLGFFFSVENLFDRHNPLAYRQAPGDGTRLIPIPIRSRTLNVGVRLRY